MSVTNISLSFYKFKAVSSISKVSHILLQLSGKMAPTVDGLSDWLEANPAYDVGEESAALVRAKVSVTFEWKNFQAFPEVKEKSGHKMS